MSSWPGASRSRRHAKAAAEKVMASKIEGAAHSAPERGSFELFVIASGCARWVVLCSLRLVPPRTCRGILDIGSSTSAPG